MESNRGRMNPNSPLAIYGAGGHARVAASIIRRLGGTVLGYFDDSFHGEEDIDGAPVMGTFRDIMNARNTCHAARIAVAGNRRECTVQTIFDFYQIILNV